MFIHLTFLLSLIFILISLKVQLINSLIMQQPFPPLKNDRLIRVAKGLKTDKLPVWIMRQAGRYLPEFQELRREYSFFEICQTPKLACEATLMPLKRFNLDAAIIFSDILVIPQALGMTVEMQPGVGPVLPKPLTIENMKMLQVQGAVSRLQYVGDAITTTRYALKGEVPLFGFSGAPWTLMGYMIEGGGSKTMSKAKKWLYCHPEASKQLLDILTEVITEFLLLQIEHGAQIVQVFDSSAEYLNRQLYFKYCLPYLRKIAYNVKRRIRDTKMDVPLVIFAKGAHFCLEEMESLGYDVVGIDWTLDPEKVGNLFRDKNVTLQGNLDPCALYAPKEELIKMTMQMIKQFGTDRLIVNLGHGIYPDADVEAVKTFVDAVHAIELK
ncbi:unnamed protein product [Callosobruchus maculatus]|uniref:Uroporphyrinogen decarboxylase n=1 Tax=Callosobruchus maculatus TaxID=64391 RepID=A0A653DM65_CALMS|nr:unnamed protein product [Callosobruchus maculatus]